jgi:hypothetical protein
MSACRIILRIWCVALASILHGAAPAAVGAGTDLECEVFYRTSDGNIKVGAGSLVLVLPASQEAKNAIAKAMTAEALATSGLVAMARATATADVSGRAWLKGLPKGRYFLVSEVRWERKGTFRNKREGGLVLANADTDASGTKIVVSN